MHIHVLSAGGQAHEKSTQALYPAWNLEGRCLISEGHRSLSLLVWAHINCSTLDFTLSTKIQQFKQLIVSETLAIVFLLWWQVIDEFSNDIHFVEIDIEEDPEIAEAGGIMGTPCVQFFKNRERIKYVLSELAYIGGQGMQIYCMFLLLRGCFHIFN